MARWNEGAVNCFSGAKLTKQTTYEQRYLRSAIRMILPRLPHTSKAAEFGAGYGRMTPVLEEWFDEAIGFEREAELVELNKVFPSPVKLINIENLAKVPAENGEFAFCFICTVLQHMLDEEVAAAIKEMKRIAEGGFILLIEDTYPNIHGEYGPSTYFTKGRKVEAYQELMSPWSLDFVRPRHMGGTAGEVWGQFMMFRAPGVPSAGLNASGEWGLAELRP